MSGTFHLFGGGTYQLRSSISSTATTIPLKSFTEPITGADITMSLMNTDICYMTLEPKTARSEFISFTGITQNSDGTADLTGVTRGLKRGYDYGASSSYRISHGGGSKAIISDAPEALNQLILPRTGTTTSSATPSINTDNVGYYSITALATNVTSFTTNLSGTPVDGQTLWIAITDNGTPRTLTWGSGFENSGNVTLPSTTVTSTRIDIRFVWDSATSKWRCVGYA